jgi:hypothetical protein
MDLHAQRRACPPESPSRVRPGCGARFGPAHWPTPAEGMRTMREPFRTSFLSTSVAAGPDEVWRVLVGASASTVATPGIEAPGAMLPDRVLLSDWRPGSSVQLTTAGTDVYGIVLRAVAPYRLTYTLGAPARDDDDATVIVTWDVLPTATGRVVTLAVDDLWPDGGDDLSNAWAQVLAEVESRLAALTPRLPDPRHGSDRG